MTHEELVAYCLAKPGAWEDMPWEGDRVAKVGDKIFAFFGTGGEEAPGVGLKCGRDADEAGEWRERYPGAVTVSPYIGRYGWNSILLDGSVPHAELLELVDASYDAVVAKLPKSKRPG
jgi:predicted DNA-binding protein (MmcQ/YjbR family)